MMRHSMAFALLGATALVGVSALAPSAKAQKMYEGIEINLLTRPGPVIAGRLEERGLEYQEMTGAKVNVATVPFADLFQKLLTGVCITLSLTLGLTAAARADTDPADRGRKRQCGA